MSKCALTDEFIHAVIPSFTVPLSDLPDEIPQRQLLPEDAIPLPRCQTLPIIHPLKSVTRSSSPNLRELPMATFPTRNEIASHRLYELPP